MAGKRVTRVATAEKAKKTGEEDSSKRVDAYIAKSCEFAQPILNKVRELFHKACPDIEETIKWSVPHFDYKGMVGGMAAFKNHVSVSFWKGKLLKNSVDLFAGVGDTEMCAIKFADISELPSERVLIACIKEAVALNEKGVKVPQVNKSKREPIKVPHDLLAALNKNKKARATFDAFSYTNRKEYVEWITEAKREATRAKRLGTAIEWMAEGKSRNWKYQKC